MPATSSSKRTTRSRPVGSAGGHVLLDDLECLLQFGRGAELDDLGAGVEDRCVAGADVVGVAGFEGLVPVGGLEGELALDDVDPVRALAAVVGETDEEIGEVGVGGVGLEADGVAGIEVLEVAFVPSSIESLTVVLDALSVVFLLVECAAALLRGRRVGVGAGRGAMRPTGSSGVVQRALARGWRRSACGDAACERRCLVAGAPCHRCVPGDEMRPDGQKVVTAAAHPSFGQRLCRRGLVVGEGQPGAGDEGVRVGVAE